MVGGMEGKYGDCSSSPSTKASEFEVDSVAVVVVVLVVVVVVVVVGKSCLCTEGSTLSRLVSSWRGSLPKNSSSSCF